MSRFSSLTLALLLTGPALAGDQPAAPDLGKAIAPLTDGQTFAVFHARLDKVNAASLVKSATQIADLQPGEAAQLQISMNVALGVLKNAGVQEVYGVAGLEGFPFNVACLAVPVAKEEDGKKMIATLQNFPGAGGVFKGSLHAIPGFVIYGPKTVAERLAHLKSAPPPHLGKALAAFDKADIQLAVVLPDSLRRSLGELAPTLPKEFGGAKTAPLLKGFQYFAAGIMLTPKVSVEATLQTVDAKAAAATLKALSEAVKGIKDHVQKQSIIPEVKDGLDKAIGLLTPKVDKDRLTWTLSEEQIIPIAQPLVAQMHAAAKVAESSNNLRQIGVAMHTYHDAHKHFPANVTDKNGKALLSWRVETLPYVEQANLYQQFKLDEPWDSAHNKALIKQIPPIFRPPTSKAEAGKTVYLCPSGKGLFLSGTPLKITDIKDGTSNTLMVLEVDDDHAATWTKPDDLVIDPKQPLKGLGGNPAGQFHGLYADGSVEIFNRTANPAAFYGLLTIDGGEARPADLYKDGKEK